MEISSPVANPAIDRVTPPTLHIHAKLTTQKLAECIFQTKKFLRLCKNTLAYYNESAVVNAEVVGLAAELDTLIPVQC
jgi:hypothetical protein